MPPGSARLACFRRTPRMCSAYWVSYLWLLVGSSLHNWTRTPDHLVQCGPRGHHRINSIFLLHLEINQHWSIVLAGRLNCGHDLRALSHGRIPNSVGPSNLGEIRFQQWGSLVVAFVEEFLPLAHHSQKAVVDDGNVDLKILLHDGGEFAHGHLKATVSDDHPDLSLRPRDLGSDRSGQGKSHRPQTSGGDQRTRFLVLVVLRFPHLVLANIGHDHGVTASSLPPKIVDDMRGVEMTAIRQVLNIADRGVTFQPIDKAHPLTAINGLNSRQNCMQDFSDIANQRHI